jgi:hypothetical protein
MSADDKYEQENDMTSGDVPAGDPTDNDYVSRTGQSEIPVVKDDAPVEEPMDTADRDSDETLRMFYYVPFFKILMLYDVTRR